MVNQNSSLYFDSNFEGGNLDAVYYQNGGYKLLIRPDSNTNGHCHYFNFKYYFQIFVEQNVKQSELINFQLSTWQNNTLYIKEGWDLMWRLNQVGLGNKKGKMWTIGLTIFYQLKTRTSMSWTFSLSLMKDRIMFSFAMESHFLILILISL